MYLYTRFVYNTRNRIEITVNTRNRNTRNAPARYEKYLFAANAPGKVEYCSSAECSDVVARTSEQWTCTIIYCLLCHLGNKSATFEIDFIAMDLWLCPANDKISCRRVDQNSKIRKTYTSSSAHICIILS